MLKKVILIHRRDTLRAEKILQERLFNNPKVEVIWNSVLKEIIGIDNPLCVEAIKIENQKNNKEIEIACKGVFIAIGHAPSNELILNQLETHNGGYVWLQNQIRQKLQYLVFLQLETLQISNIGKQQQLQVWDAWRLWKQKNFCQKNKFLMNFVFFKSYLIIRVNFYCFDFRL